MMVNGDFTLFWGKMRVKSGEAPASPLRRKNMAGITFLKKTWSKQWNMKESLSFLVKMWLK